MGNFRVVIEGVGGHGCQREVKSGGEVQGCGRMGCPDCEVRRFVHIINQPNVAGLTKAELMHWPEQKEEVKDNLLTGIRTGSFVIFAFLAAILVAMLIPSVAMAADAVAPAVDAGTLFLQTAMTPIAGALVTVLLALGAFLTAWLRNKSAQASTTAGAKVAEQLGAKALDIMIAAVRTTYATLRENMEKSLADGSFTQAEKDKMRTETIAAFLASLGDEFKKQLLGGLGLSETGLSTTYASGLLEQALSVVKVEKAREQSIRAQAEANVATAKTTTVTQEDLLQKIGAKP